MILDGATGRYDLGFYKPTISQVVAPSSSESEKLPGASNTEPASTRKEEKKNA